MKNLLTALFEYKLKAYGLISAGVLICIDLILIFTGNFYMNSHNHHVLIHYSILLGLLIAVNSKDKVDDELSHMIRYSVFKNTLSMSAVFIGITVLLLSTFEVEKISTLVFVYILEGMLGLHLILYQIGIKRSPQWMLKEETVPERMNRVMKAFLIIMPGMIFLLIILSIIIEIQGEA